MSDFDAGQEHASITEAPDSHHEVEILHTPKPKPRIESTDLEKEFATNTEKKSAEQRYFVGR